MQRRVRNAVVALVLTAVMLLAGAVAVSAGHKGGGQGGSGSTTGTCSLSPAVVGSPLTITGQGFTPGAHYALAVTWPYGATGYLFATADSTGAWAVYTQASWSGTYSVQVLTSRGAVAASCSETVS